MLSFKLFTEQAYEGNLGMEEMMKFYNVATAAEKKELQSLIKAKKTSEAWDLLQKVTNTKLKELA